MPHCYQRTALGFTSTSLPLPSRNSRRFFRYTTTTTTTATTACEGHVVHPPHYHHSHPHDSHHHPILQIRQKIRPIRRQWHCQTQFSLSSYRTTSTQAYRRHLSSVVSTEVAPLYSTHQLHEQEQQQEQLLPQSQPTQERKPASETPSPQSSPPPQSPPVLGRQPLMDLGRASSLSAYFPFPLDDWQVEAADAIAHQYNVIVCAPTGAGKTVVGEMALLHAVYTQRTHGIYTTPLKALSNQKFSDLRNNLFPQPGQVGLLTGDLSINRNTANVTVMTTEVYRNWASRTDNHHHQQQQKQRVDLNETGVVVFDEFQYMGKPGRGGVWEESVITSPLHIQMVALSATLPNAQNIARWMEAVTTRKTVYISAVSQQRPVPLRYLFASDKHLDPLFRDPDAGPGAPRGLLGFRPEERSSGTGASATATMTTTTSEETRNHRASEQQRTGRKRGAAGFKRQKEEEEKASAGPKPPRGLQVNPVLRAAAKKRLWRVQQDLARYKAQMKYEFRTRSKYDYDNDRDSDNNNIAWFRKSVRQPLGELSPREEQKERERLLRKELRRSVPSMHALVKRLQEKELLPAIVFIFSRMGCDEAARSLAHTLKGPRDPNRLMREEMDELFIHSDRGGDRSSPSRLHSRVQSSHLMEDNTDGGTFRPPDDSITEETLTSMNEPAEPLSDDELLPYSPLSSENWNFYSSAGLLNYTQVKDVAARISRFNENNQEIMFDDETIEQFLLGIGSHHAGMLPAAKSFVEALFRNQLMKVVFATETLAAGINMPARTTVVCALTKMDESSSINFLETSNLLQMAGRAGRRGMDTDGTCVIVANPFATHDEAAKILTDPIKPIASQFAPTYSLITNLIARGDGKLDLARQLMGKSFARWQTNKMDPSTTASNNQSAETGIDENTSSPLHRFISMLLEAIQLKLESENAGFDITEELQNVSNVFEDKVLLKIATKEWDSTQKLYELEQATLCFLEKELEDNRDFYNKAEDQAVLAGFDEQIELQSLRVHDVKQKLCKHPFTIVADVCNDLMNDDFSEGVVLLESLYAARDQLNLSYPGTMNKTSPDEIAKLAKSVLLVQRKTSSIVQSSEPDSTRDNLWDDLVTITKTLIRYGCLTTSQPYSDDTNVDAYTYEVTPAGKNVAMLGLDNSLWCVVAVGGAWNVDPVTGTDVETSRKDAETLVNQLLLLSPGEMAGYISCLTNERARSGGFSVEEMSLRLTASQQDAVHSAFVVMDQLGKVQRELSIDGSARFCSLDISNCGVVTAWADGCSWADALKISEMQPGDLVRALSRVLDALRQMGKLPYTPVSDWRGGIHPKLRRLCRVAVKRIHRYPLKDDIAFTNEIDADFDENEILDEQLLNDEM